MSNMTVAGNNSMTDPSKMPQGRQFSAQDILVPKLLICQPTSDLGEETPPGSFVRSTDLVVIGKEINIIPLSSFRTWTIFELTGSKPKFKRVESCTFENEDLPWEFQEDGVPMRRDKVLNFYCLVPQDIEREKAAIISDDPDPDDALLPIVVSFSRTSYKVGKELTTHFAKIEKFRNANPNVSLYPSAFKLTTELNTNDNGKWYTYKIESKEKSNVEHRATCGEWHKIVNSGAAQVHEVDENSVKSESSGDESPPNIEDPSF